jgi:hypothetical protein
MIGDSLQVVGVVVEIVTIGDLPRATMPAAIMSNDAEALAEKKKHLRVPIVRA